MSLGRARLLPSHFPEKTGSAGGSPSRDGYQKRRTATSSPSVSHHFRVPPRTRMNRKCLVIAVALVLAVAFVAVFICIGAGVVAFHLAAREQARRVRRVADVSHPLVLH